MHATAHLRTAPKPAVALDDDRGLLCFTWHFPCCRCGAPNLSFLAALEVSASKLPHHRTAPPDLAAPALDRAKIYLGFQSNEGDTPKNAYSFRGGNWLLEGRGRSERTKASSPLPRQNEE